MSNKLLQLQGVTHADRHGKIDQIKNAIQAGGGYILDFQMFSNVAICINFEVTVGNLGKLRSALERESVLNEESLAELANCGKELADTDQDADVKGTLNVTFVHNEPDLRIEAPPIPG